MSDILTDIHNEVKQLNSKVSYLEEILTLYKKSYFTTRQAIMYIGQELKDISERTFYRWVQDNNIPYNKNSSTDNLFKKSDIEYLIELKRGKQWRERTSE